MPKMHREIFTEKRHNHSNRYTYTHCSRVSFKVGKLVVATNELEEQRLMDLWERANKNGVPDIEIVDSRLKKTAKQSLL